VNDLSIWVSKDAVFVNAKFMKRLKFTDVLRGLMLCEKNVEWR
jgi:hypothetical protein